MTDHSIQNMKILVTGASGFLGARLCARLLEGGAEIHATSRARRVSDHANLHWLQCDLAKSTVVKDLLAAIRPDVIFHLAGHVTAAPHANLVLPTFHSLLASTVNILATASTIGCRRVVVTGSLTEPEPGCVEVVPSSPYAAAKWAGTAYARMFHQLYCTPVVIVRPFMTYGPGQHREKIIPHTICSLLLGNPPKLASGEWRADWIYVEDVIDGFLSAACRSGVDGCTIDLGSGALTSTREVVVRLSELINPKLALLFGSVPDRPAERVRVADTHYAKEKLGWEPRTSLDRGLEQTIRWYQGQLNHLREGLSV